MGMKRQRGNGCAFTLVAMPTRVAEFNARHTFLVRDRSTPFDICYLTHKWRKRINNWKTLQIRINLSSTLLGPANGVWGKVMFLHPCVILFTGRGGDGVQPPYRKTPPRHRHPLGRHPPETATEAGGTHPTGMHSCSVNSIHTNAKVKDPSKVKQKGGETKNETFN